MSKHNGICAKNIYEITRKSARNPDKFKEKAPSIKTSIQKKQKELEDDIAFYEDKCKKENKKYKNKLKKAKEKQQRFKEITSPNFKLPNGFKLKIIISAKPSTQAYKHHIRNTPNFILDMRFFVASKHYSQLENIGVCKYGINELLNKRPACIEQIKHTLSNIKTTIDTPKTTKQEHEKLLQEHDKKLSKAFNNVQKLKKPLQMKSAAYVFNSKNTLDIISKLKDHKSTASETLLKTYNKLVQHLENNKKLHTNQKGQENLQLIPIKIAC